MKICSVEWCNKKHSAKGYCKTHYNYWLLHGRPTPEKEYVGCDVDGCKNDYYSKGYCVKHYLKLKKYGNPLVDKTIKKKTGICQIDGCDKPLYIKGLCVKHYQRVKKYGDPSVTKRNMQPPETCGIEGCKNKHSAKGLCRKHYSQINKKKYLQSEKGRELVRLNCQKRRAQKRNVPINDFRISDWRECLEYYSHSCAYCGKNEEKLTQDHIIPTSLGGSNTKTNIVPACGHCNYSKGNNLMEEWYPKKDYYDKEKETKIIKWMGLKVTENKIQTKLF